MPYERTGYAPWSLTREAGIQSATVDGTIQVPQYIQPVLSTGFVDEKGNWKGTKSSDESFFISDKALAIGNGVAVLFPNTADHDFIDMTGYSALFIAILPTNGGNMALKAVMGPSTQGFANLRPVNAGAALKYSQNFTGTSSTFTACLDDSSEAMTADVWNIFLIERVANQKLLQLEVTNNTGGNSDIDFAYLRVV